MPFGRGTFRLAALLLLTWAAVADAQKGPPRRPAEGAEQEEVKVYTEEVLLPVVALDEAGRFDPRLEPDDILVLEDGVPQQVRSVRRLPASVLFVFDMGGQVTETRSPETTREIALGLAAALGDEDSVALVQNSDRVEVLADWSSDREGVAQVLRTKLFSGRRSRLTECLLLAAELLRERAAGNAHLVVFTDGVESGRGGAATYDEAVRRLAATQATAHVITYSALARRAARRRNRGFLDLDSEMKRWRSLYGEATRHQDERLAALVGETGGRLLVPASAEEAARQGREVARDIGAQYVVSYRPRQPFVAGGAERRRVEVSSRRLGLQLVSLRGHVSPPPPQRADGAP